MKRLIFAAIALLVLISIVLAAPRLRRFLAEDGCLDEGGAVGPDATCVLPDGRVRSL